MSEKENFVLNEFNTSESLDLSGMSDGNAAVSHEAGRSRLKIKPVVLGAVTAAVVVTTIAVVAVSISPNNRPIDTSAPDSDSLNTDWQDDDTSRIEIYEFEELPVNIAEETTTKKSTKKKKTSTVAVKGLSFDFNKESIKVGDSLIAEVKFTPENATNQKCTWSVSDSSVAGLETNGVLCRLTGKKAGTVTVTAVSAANSKYKASFKLTVVAEESTTETDTASTTEENTTTTETTTTTEEPVSSEDTQSTTDQGGLTEIETSINYSALIPVK